MSRPHPPTATLSLSISLAAALSCAALGCGDSGNAAGALVTNEATSSECNEALGDECSTASPGCTDDAECGAGSCLDGACSAPEPGGGCTGPGCMTGGGLAGAGGFLVDDVTGPGVDEEEEEAVCVDLDVEFQRVTPTVVLLIDQSGSMERSFDTVIDGGRPVNRDRWEALVSTLTDPATSLIKELEDSVRFGMALYTSQDGFGTGSMPKACPQLDSVDIGLGSFSDISRTLERSEPQSDTPTAESIDAIVAELVAFEEQGPKSIILATDGDPDTCEDPDSNGQNASKALSEDAVEAAYLAGIRTHVISVGDDATADHLQAMAELGAGGDPLAQAYTALDTQALVEAFNDIIGDVRTCDFALEGSVAARDAARGSVILDSQELVFGDANGWEMPDEQTVRLLGEACEQVLEAADGISMSFPCDAIEIIPR